jgi:hypothetical protein
MTVEEEQRAESETFEGCSAELPRACKRWRCGVIERRVLDQFGTETGYTAFLKIL